MLVHCARRHRGHWAEMPDGPTLWRACAGGRRDDQLTSDLRGARQHMEFHCNRLLHAWLATRAPRRCGRWACGSTAWQCRSATRAACSMPARADETARGGKVSGAGHAMNPAFVADLVCGLDRRRARPAARRRHYRVLSARLDCSPSLEDRHSSTYAAAAARQVSVLRAGAPAAGCFAAAAAAAPADLRSVTIPPRTSAPCRFTFINKATCLHAATAGWSPAAGRPDHGCHRATMTSAPLSARAAHRRGPCAALRSRGWCGAPTATRTSACLLTSSHDTAATSALSFCNITRSRRKSLCRRHAGGLRLQRGAMQMACGHHNDRSKIETLASEQTSDRTST